MSSWLVGHTRLYPGTNLHMMSWVLLCPKQFGQIIVSPQFSYCTPSHYLMGRRILAPFDRDIPIPGRFGEILWWSWVFLAKEQGWPNKGSGGQFSLPGSPGTNLHMMSWVLRKVPQPAATFAPKFDWEDMNKCSS